MSGPKTGQRSDVRAPKVTKIRALPAESSVRYFKLGFWWGEVVTDGKGEDRAQMKRETRKTIYIKKISLP